MGNEEVEEDFLFVQVIAVVVVKFVLTTTILVVTIMVVVIIMLAVITGRNFQFKGEIQLTIEVKFHGVLYAEVSITG